MDKEKQLELALHCLDEHKAEDLKPIDVEGISPFAAYYVLATAPNLRALGALAELLEDELEKNGVSVLQKEGNPDSGWIILATNELIVHLFSSVNRKEFDLEGLLAKLKGQNKDRDEFALPNA